MVGAALASYHLGTRLFNRPAAVAVSIAYLYSRYFLMEVWTGSAVTVLLSLAVIPFLFAAIHRVTQEARWRSYTVTSLAAALITLAHPLTTFYHVIDDQGKLLAQTDSRPQGYASNTNRWIPGQVVADRFEVPLPPDAPPGRYPGAPQVVWRSGWAAGAVLDVAGKSTDHPVLLGYCVKH